MTHPIVGLSSMATRGLLAELAAAWEGDAKMEAAGGVDAARRVRAGEAVDVVILADGAMRGLARDGLVLDVGLTGIAISGAAVAVREHERLPDLSDPAALRHTLLTAGRIGYSTGPSGDHLLRLLEGWGRDAFAERLVQAPPGVPVGRLLADGTVDLAIQQNSELIGLPGIVIAGEFPGETACDTLFTAGISSASSRAEEAARFIAFLASAGSAAVKRRYGMRPVSTRPSR